MGLNTSVVVVVVVVSAQVAVVEVVVINCKGESGLGQQGETRQFTKSQHNYFRSFFLRVYSHALFLEICAFLLVLGLSWGLPVPKVTVSFALLKVLGGPCTIIKGGI